MQERLTGAFPANHLHRRPESPTILPTQPAPPVWSDFFYTPTSRDLSQSTEAQPKIENLAEQNIFDSHNPFNDANTLRKYQDLSLAQQYNLTFEQVAGFGDEFAGKIKKKTIAGILRANGTLEMFGIDTMAMYQRTADMAGPNSREHYDLVGLRTIHQSFLQHMRDEDEGKPKPSGHNAADWISPPKDANYGVLYSQRLGPRDEQTGDRLFVEYIFMYDENARSLEESRRIYSTLVSVNGQSDNKANRFLSYTDFLVRPILFSPDQPDNLSYLYHTLGITKRDIQKALLYQNASRAELKPLISAYFQTVKEWSQISTFGDKDEINQHFATQAEMYLGAFYNAAKKIKQRIDETVMLYDYRPTITIDTGYIKTNHRESLYVQAQRLAASDKLVIYGGSNCEVTKRSADGLPSMNTIVDALEQGMTINQVFEKAGIKPQREKYNCPGCGKEYPGEESDDPTKWVQDCSCGHKFGCAL